MKEYKLLNKYEDIIDLIDQIDVVAYARGRNYIDGAVSYLSPYISRGVVSLPLIKERILSRFTKQQAYTFIFELAWREYFQRQWEQLGDTIWTDIKQPQVAVRYKEIPDALLHATTGIEAIDEAINKLYTENYMHNHVRMYTASVGCNIGHAHWLQLSKWMYYHLADHDIASNTLSWQWIAGTFSSKKYYCDQNNINKYCRTMQQNTFLNVPYEQLPDMDVPEVLKAHSQPLLQTILPEKKMPILDPAKPLLLYNAYNLNPLWRTDMEANRVLLIEPSHYAKYPVSDRVLTFILLLSQNIDGIQVFSGEADELIEDNNFSAIYSSLHPAFAHYSGEKDEREWMFPQVDRVKGSFMTYWKKCEFYL